MYRLFSSLFFIACSLSTVTAQEDFSWWNELHNWDGFTPWERYLTVSPGFLGPNALPVPTLQNGRIPAAAQVTLGAAYHFHTGDPTQNLEVSGFVPLFHERIGMELRIVPIERYSFTPAIRDERRVRDFDGKGWATGDLYVSTYVQLVQDHEKWPDVLLTINLRTASGNRLTAGRYTDTPGYYFDLSCGKTYEWGRATIRPHLMGGFYVWQTFTSNAFQNDAFLYGAGLDWKFSKFSLSNGLAGYAGYLNNGDHPIVARTSVQSDFPGSFNFRVEVQRGLQDYGYSSLRLTGIYEFDRE